MCDSRGLLEGVNPLLAVSTDLGHARGPVFALGVFGPSGLHRTTYTQRGRATDEPALVRLVDASGKERVTWAPSRYDLVEDQLEVLYVTPAVAFEPTPGLRVGVSLQWVFARLAFTTYGALLADDPGGMAIRNEASAIDPFTPAAVLAVQARPLPTVEVGASFRWSAGLRASGDLDISVTTIEDGAERSLGRDRVGIELSVGQPAELRAGVRWFLPRGVTPTGDPMTDEVLDLELDWIFETYSAVDAITLRSDDPIHMCSDQGGACIDSPPVGRVDLPHHWRDTHSLRLGGDWNVLPGRLAVRAGGSWESAAAPESLTLLDFAAVERFGLHAGATLRLGRLDVSVAAAHLFGETRTVTDGGARVASPAGRCDPEVPDCVTNEGRHTSSIDMVSLSVSARL
jgi:long-subunit fatty acid transport protein